MNSPQGIAIDSSGNIYIAKYYANQIIKIPVGGTSLSVIDSDVLHPRGIALDSLGTIYIADTDNHRVKKIKNGVITIIADGILPFHISVDLFGNVFVTDCNIFGIVVYVASPILTTSTVMYSKQTSSSVLYSPKLVSLVSSASSLSNTWIIVTVFASVIFIVALSLYAWRRSI